MLIIIEIINCNPTRTWWVGRNLRMCDKCIIVCAKEYGDTICTKVGHNNIEKKILVEISNCNKVGVRSKTSWISLFPIKGPSNVPEQYLNAIDSAVCNNNVYPTIFVQISSGYWSRSSSIFDRILCGLRKSQFTLQSYRGNNPFFIFFRVCLNSNVSFVIYMYD